MSNTHPHILRNLSVLAYANGFTLWHALSKVAGDFTTPGNLNDARDLLNPGDFVIVSGVDNTFGTVQRDGDGCPIIAPVMTT